MLTVSHPTGNQNLRALLAGVADAGLLSAFHTSLASFEGDWLYRLAGLPGLSEFRRRSFPASVRAETHQHPLYDLTRILALRAGATGLTRSEGAPFSIDSVYHDLDRRVAASLRSGGGSRAVYAYEDGARDTFRAAHLHGQRCIYDLPIGYWRSASAILAAELDAKPEWAPTVRTLDASPAKLGRKDEELHLADAIFVASAFTASTLRDYPGQLAPIHKVSYGYPNVTAERDYRARRAGEPLRLLFVGGLSQRKGLSYVFEAAEALGNDVALTVIGHKPPKFCAPLERGLNACTYIPSLPHADVLKLMREHDVLLFPSLFEGFGLVITEAMSQGTPVITTAHTAGPDVLTHGEEGWIVETSTAEPIVEILADLIRHPEKAVAVGEAAQARARHRPWSVYGREAAAELRELLTPAA